MDQRRRLRVVWRVTGIAVWTLVMAALRASVRPLRWVSAPAEARARASCLRIWGRGLARVAHVRLTIHGTPPMPPFFLVSNHLSHVDIPLLAAATGCVFVSRADIALWPVIGVIVRMSDAVFIDRSSLRETLRVNDLLAARLDQGYGVHVFAESRISQDGTLQPFKPALLETPARRNMPVHYVAIHYRTPEGAPSARDSVIWHNNSGGFANSVRTFLTLPSCEATLTFGPAPIPYTDRKQLAAALHDAIAELLEPIR